MSPNAGNVVALIKSETEPTKKYIIWAHIVNPSNPNFVVLKRYDFLKSAWVEFRDDLLFRGVLGVSVDNPPASPNLGDAYIVGTSPTGAWVGQEKKHAEWTGDLWVFRTPANHTIVSQNTVSNTELWVFKGDFATGGWNLFASTSTAIGTVNEWAAGTYNYNALVLYDRKLYQLAAITPYSSSDFVAEADAGDWLIVGEPKAWATSTQYTQGEHVYQNGGLYRCVIGHTSGTFSVDLGNGNWTFVVGISGSENYFITFDASGAPVETDEIQKITGGIAIKQLLEILAGGKIKLGTAEIKQVASLLRIAYGDASTNAVPNVEIDADKSVVRIGNYYVGIENDGSNNLFTIAFDDGLTQKKVKFNGIDNITGTKLLTIFNTDGEIATYGTGVQSAIRQINAGFTSNLPSAGVYLGLGTGVTSGFNGRSDFTPSGANGLALQYVGPTCFKSVVIECNIDGNNTITREAEIGLTRNGTPLATTAINECSSSMPKQHVSLFAARVILNSGDIIEPVIRNNANNANILHDYARISIF